MPYGRNLSALNAINHIAIFLKTSETVFWFRILCAKNQSSAKSSSRFFGNQYCSTNSTTLAYETIVATQGRKLRIYLYDYSDNVSRNKYTNTWLKSKIKTLEWGEKYIQT